MKLSIGDIVIDDNLNVRDELDKDTIERYAECFDQLPPVVVFDIDDGYLLADGFHRVEAAKRLGRTDIDADVREGTRKDTEEYAALANLTHGKPLTRAERRKAVEQMLRLHTERANNWIAEDTGISKNTVAKYREDLESKCQIDRCLFFITKDGREYPREIEQPKRPQKDEDVTQESEAPQDTGLHDETPSLDEQPQTNETPTVEPEPQEEAPEQPQEGDVSEPEVQVDVTETTKGNEEVAQEASETYDDADENSYENTQDISDKDHVNNGNPEGWDTFVGNFNWIKDYAFELATQDNFDAVSNIQSIFNNLAAQLDTALEDMTGV